MNSRNGYRHRDWDTRAGTVELAVPKLRHGSPVAGDLATEFLDRHDAASLAKSAFSPVERASFRLLGIRRFMLLQVAR